ncbi:MAG: TonB family protein [Bryobacteraceae bacterium]
MRLFTAVLLLIPGAMASQTTQSSEDWKIWLERGTQEFKQGHYSEAAASFEKAAALRPEEVQPHLYLGTAWMNQYIPGADSPENLVFARRAETEFQRVLELDPKNVAALFSLASLSYLQAQGVTDLTGKSRLLETARDRFQTLVRIDPGNKFGHYSLGVIAWALFYPHWSNAHQQAGLGPEMPGPLPNLAVRLELKSQYERIVSDGLKSLARALEIDPQYDDAMAYMNLLVREWADVADSPEEYARQVAQADEWMQKALDTRKAKMAAGLPAQPAPPARVTSVPQAPAGGGGGGTSGRETPRRIAVRAEIEAQYLQHKVDPVYPPLATQARIQGTVRFNVIIDKDGHVTEIELVSGHPLLVKAAREAVSQWVYRPILLNGQPMEVVTTVDVVFRLDSPAVAPTAPSSPPIS